MAQEILNDEDYTKCDLWSLGIIIYQLYTKNFSYKGAVERAIIKEIYKKWEKVLDLIYNNDKELKDLLSHLLVKDPDQRYSWGEYCQHPFFN